MAIGSRPSAPTIRVMLIGQTGSGKSSTGNTILSVNGTQVERYFSVALTADKGNTRHGEKFSVFIPHQNIKLEVIDVPGFQNIRDGPKKVELEIREIMKRAVEIDVFLFVVGIFEYGLEMNEAELKNLQIIESIFGEKVWEHTIFVFTHGANYENQRAYEMQPNIRYPRLSFDEYIQKNAFTGNKLAIGPYLSKVQNRAALFENKDALFADMKTMVYDLSAKILVLYYAKNGTKYSHLSMASNKRSWSNLFARLFGISVFVGAGYLLFPNVRKFFGNCECLKALQEFCTRKLSFLL